MIKIENVTTAGWEPALRGMRNPLNSWDKADSKFGVDWVDDSVWPHEHGHDDVSIGPNDHDLAMRLRNAGTDHRKFMRMIVCYADITAPLYWWKEFDTYRSGVEKNSCSTMHKIAEKEFTLDDFSTDHLSNEIIVYDAESVYREGTAIHSGTSFDVLSRVVGILNEFREEYGKTGLKSYWWQMIQLLPSSYNQKRTVMMSYEALANMYHARRNHRLDEWREFCKWVESLPYSELITGKEEKK